MLEEEFPRGWHQGVGRLFIGDCMSALHWAGICARHIVNCYNEDSPFHPFCVRMWLYYIRIPLPKLRGPKCQLCGRRPQKKVCPRCGNKICTFCFDREKRQCYNCNGRWNDNLLIAMSGVSWQERLKYTVRMVLGALLLSRSAPQWRLRHLLLSSHHGLGLGDSAGCVLLPASRL